MKQTTKNWLGMAALILGSSAVTGAVVKGTASNSQPLVEQPAMSIPASVAAPSGLVDLTSAAESAVESVVYIKVTQTGKTQRVQVMPDFFDPFGFGDIFGFGGRGGQPQEREYKQPDRHAAGSGVIISTDGYIVTNNHVVGDADERLGTHQD